MTEDDNFVDYAEEILRRCQAWGQIYPKYNSTLKKGILLLKGLPETGPLGDFKKFWWAEYRRTWSYTRYRNIRLVSRFSWESMLAKCRQVLREWELAKAREGFGDSEFGIVKEGIEGNQAGPSVVHSVETQGSVVRGVANNPVEREVHIARGRIVRLW